MADPVVKQADKGVAEKLLKDDAFRKQHDLQTIYHVVHDPANPHVILSMTVMETSATGKQ